MKKRITASALALVMALSVCITAMPISNVQAKENDAQVQEDNSQEAAETIDEVFGDKKYDSINWQTDFEYEIEGNNIVLRKYIGDAEVVNIPATATIDGVSYTVKLNDNCYAFFRNCKNTKSISFSKDIDTSNVTDMSEMFDTCRNLTDLDISGFDTSNVTDMHFMFYDCRSLKSVDVSGFDTSNVTNMICMFFYCQNLTNLDVSGFDTSQVTDMFNMFFGCRSLTNLDVSGFDTRNVTNMGAMFADCRELTSIDVSGFDTSKVTNMLAMFCDCEKVTNLDVSGFNTSLVTNMSEMFRGCKGLTTLDLSNFDMSSLSSDSTRAYEKMLDGCVSLMEIRTRQPSILCSL